jgi:hypothetical protein
MSPPAETPVVASSSLRTDGTSRRSRPPTGMLHPDAASESIASAAVRRVVAASRTPSTLPDPRAPTTPAGRREARGRWG